MNDKRSKSMFQLSFKLELFKPTSRSGQNSAPDRKSSMSKTLIRVIEPLSPAVCFQENEETLITDHEL